MASSNLVQRTFRVCFGLLLVALAATRSYGGFRHHHDIVSVQEHRLPVARSITHYIVTHKFPLAIDTALVLANADDARSTLRAAHICPTCIDYALGRNPSPAKTWGELMGFSAGLVAFNQLAYHHYRDDGTDPSWMGQKFFVLMFSVPVIVHGIADAKANEQIQAPAAAVLARQRLIGR